MYLGCAPVSTFAGGVREVIDEGSNGFLVEYGDEEHLASLIERLYRNENERKIISRKAKETVVRQFTIPVMTESIAAFCKEISDMQP